MYQFSDETLNLLLKHDWSPNRRVDIEPYLQFYAETDQPVSDLIRDFLRSFADIEVSAYTKKSHILYEVFYINPLKVGHRTLKEYAESWIQKPLCGVGRADSNDIFAFTPDGEGYIMFDSYVYKIGNTIVESIETLCTEGQTERIFKPAQDL